MMARLVARLTRPAIDHWRGQQPWLATLLVSVLALTYGYGLAFAEMPSLPATIGIGGCATVGSVLLVWQVVGVLRAIKLNSMAPVDVTAIWGGYLTILIAVGFVGLTMTDGIVRYLPKPEVRALMSGPRFDVSFNPVGPTVTLNGEVSYAAMAALRDVLAERPETNRLVLNSRGGHVFAARAIASRVLALGLATHVDRECYSACTIVFASGGRRTLGDQGQLGFHSYGFESNFAVQTVDPVVEQDKDRQFFRSRGVREDFLARVFNSSHDDLWKPDHATLLAARVITSQSE